jgi:hypothetical protein
VLKSGTSRGKLNHTVAMKRRASMPRASLIYLRLVRRHPISSPPLLSLNLRQLKALTHSSAHSILFIPHSSALHRALSQAAIPTSQSLPRLRKERSMTPARLLQLEMQAFLFLMMATIAWQLLTRRIPLTGLLMHKDSGGNVSAGRVQLLLATVAACGSYLTEVAKATNGKLPDVSANWLYVFGGSSGIYVLDKVWSMWSNRSGN